MKKITRLFNNLTDRQVLYLLVVIVVISSVWSAILNLTSPQPDFQAWGEGWLQNFSTEMMGAISTYFLFTLIIGKREEKERLFIQLRSKDSATASNALNELQIKVWLYDGSLQGADLEGVTLPAASLRHANLAGSSLKYANLENADLMSANLSGANLWNAGLAGANLEDALLTSAWLHNALLQEASLRKAVLFKADLTQANLTNADLRFANLNSAFLQKANLEGTALQHTNLVSANMRQAILKGADLYYADLRDTLLEEAKFDERTTLPDGTQWEPDTDMTRFTNPYHLNFWQCPTSRNPVDISGLI